MALFRLFVFLHGVILSFRMASFRHFVFSHGVFSSFRVASFRREKTKWDNAATIKIASMLFQHSFFLPYLPNLSLLFEQMRGLNDVRIEEHRFSYVGYIRVAVLSDNAHIVPKVVKIIMLKSAEHDIFPANKNRKVAF